MRTHGNRRATLLLSVLLVAGLVPAGVGSAGAAGYQPVFNDGGGADAAASIFCSPGLIQLGDPVIWAIPPGDSYSTRTQWVAWNVSIWYSSDLQAWSPSGATPYWYFGLVNDRYASLVYNAQWYSTQDGAWGFHNNPRWNASLKGYYAATMQIVWYFEDGTTSSLTGQPSAYSVGAYGNWSDRSPYCTMF